MASNHIPPVPKRYITTNTVNGLSIFAPEIAPDPPFRILPDGERVTFCYGSDQFPIELTQDQDLKLYQHLIDNPPGIVLQHGVAFRVIDLPPGYASVMHRTVSVNFNIVLEGEVELILDSGERRRLRRGDSAIQRAISHSWRNVSTTEWARISAVPVPAAPLEIGGSSAHGTGIPGMGASS